AAAMEEASEAAGAAWDAWHGEGLARVGTIVAGEGLASGSQAVPDQPPIEIESALPGLAARHDGFWPLDRVTGVNPMSPTDPAVHLGPASDGPHFRGSIPPHTSV
ncbi:MAG TPA: hypothetical protein VI168_08555, partial [Croceibacterium sp.]